jgi:hypothetical protein
MASLQDYIDLIETPPDSAYDRVMMKAPVAEASNIPSYSERPKNGILDYVPTREELRQGTFDVMHDVGFSPRASRKTAQTLFGTRSDSLDESAMPVPDIGAADFLTGAAAKRLIDPLLLTDAQTARLRGDAGESTLMAGLAALPPAAYAYKEVKGLSGASDQVLEDISEVDQSRRNFLRTATGVAGIAALPSALVPPVIKMGKVVAEVPGVAKVAVKAAPVATGAIKGLGGWKTALALLGHSKSYMNDAVDVIDPARISENVNPDNLKGITDEITDMLGGADQDHLFIDFTDPRGRYADMDVPERLYADFEDYDLDTVIDDFTETLSNDLGKAKVIETRTIKVAEDVANELGQDGAVTLEKVLFEDGTEVVRIKGAYDGDDLMFSKLDRDIADSANSVLE